MAKTLSLLQAGLSCSSPRGASLICIFGGGNRFNKKSGSESMSEIETARNRGPRGRPSRRWNGEHKQERKKDSSHGKSKTSYMWFSVFGGVLGVKCPFCCLKGPLIFSGIMTNQSEIVIDWIEKKKWVSLIIKWAFDSKMCLWSQMAIFSKLGGIFFSENQCLYWFIRITE